METVRIEFELDTEKLKKFLETFTCIEVNTEIVDHPLGAVKISLLGTHDGFTFIETPTVSIKEK